MRPSTRLKALLLPDLAEEEPQALLDGSARLALKTAASIRPICLYRAQPRALRTTRTPEARVPRSRRRYPDSPGRCKQRDSEARAKDWSSHRAVLFLDPYGMQVDWTTIEAIARTKAIDLWVLFPLGIGVNRLLTKSGDIPDSWRRRLDLLLGTEDWYEEFYRSESTPTLFGGAWTES